MTKPIVRIRERASEIFSVTFPDWDITPEDIYPVSGFWKRIDVYRWEAYFNLKSRYSMVIESL